jgi:hypothetical protein
VKASFLDSGLEISLAGDLVYSQGLNDESAAEEKLSLRGAEVMFYGPIDHRWSGTLSLAAHDEAGQTNFEIHELYVDTSALLPRTHVKIGQFFLGIGRLNKFHQHDWPFTRAPKVHRDFLAEEAVFDAGIETQTILSTAPYLQLTLGLTSGYRFGHVHSQGTKPKTPTHYARLSTFKSLGSSNGFEIGSTYLGRVNSQKERLQLVGLDATAKFYQGRILRWYFSTESWYRNLSFDSASTQEELGSYFFAQYGATELLSFGARLDGFKNLSQKTTSGASINNITYGSTLISTHRSSEFFITRLSLTHEFSRIEGRTQEKDTRGMLQIVFILGAHPAHEF